MTARDEIRGLLTGFALVATLGLAIISFDVGLPGQSVAQSLRFHAAIGCLALPVALLVLGAWRRALAMLVVILLSLGLGLWPMWQLIERRAPLDGQAAVASLDLVSFNVLAHNETPEIVANYLAEQTPDVAVIMETPGIEELLPDIAKAMPYRIGCDNRATCDTSILSRLPLSEARVIRFGPFGHERLVVAKVAIDGSPVTIVAAHLSKPYFDGIADVELRQLSAQLAQIEGPVVLSGDFNAALWSDALIQFADRADLVPPTWPPGTWPTEAGDFGVPIDNMFTRGPAKIAQLDGLDPMGSNHRGLRARIDLLASP